MRTILLASWLGSLLGAFLLGYAAKAPTGDALNGAKAGAKAVAKPWNDHQPTINPAGCPRISKAIGLLGGECSQPALRVLIAHPEIASKEVITTLALCHGQLESLDRQAISKDPFASLRRDRIEGKVTFLFSFLTQVRPLHASKAVMPYVTSGTSFVREQAVITLGELGDPNSVSILIRAMKHNPRDIVAAAATALGRCGKMAALPHLNALCRDKDLIISSAAARALAELAPNADARLVALPRLSRALISDPDPAVRMACLSALRVSPTNGSIPYLIKALEDEDEVVRGDAVIALQEAGCSSALPQIRLLRRDKSDYVRLCVADAIAVLQYRL